MISFTISDEGASIFVTISYAPKTPRVSFTFLIDFSSEIIFSSDPKSQFIRTNAVVMTNHTP
jgi:hypothetical protein